MTSLEAASWWVDDPLQDTDHDRLGREAFARRVTAILNEVGSRESSTVLGLVGSWGSGKSTTMTFIVKNLDPARWSVARVEPWALSGPEEIIVELLAAISSALPDENPRTHRAREALVRYGTFAAPLLTLIPVAGASAKAMADAALNRLNGQATLAQQLRNVSAALSALKQSILVVIDDIDRLLPDQLHALLKAVRIVGRLPNIHYMLAYDEDTVLDVLASTAIAKSSPSRAIAFLEKIINIRLDQPPALQEDIDALLQGGMQELVEKFNIALSEDQVNRLSDEREALLLPVLSEPRKVVRYLAQMHVHLPMVGPESIDFTDFAVTNLIRTAYPVVFRRLAQYRRQLVDAAAAPHREFTEDAEWLRRLDLEREATERIILAIRRLFPSLTNAAGERSLPDTRRRNRDHRISDPDHVDRYFTNLIGTDKISDGTIWEALSDWGAGKRGRATEILELALIGPEPTSNEERARLLRRLEAVSEPLAPEQASRILEVASSIFPTAAARGLTDSFASAAISWISLLIRRATNMQPGRVAHLFVRPDHQVSALPAAIRALSLIHSSDEEERKQISAIRGEVLDLVWSRFLQHTRLDDAAPEEPIELYMEWMLSIMGEEALDVRIRAELDAGLSLASLLARMVELSLDPKSQRWQIQRFDAAAVTTQLRLTERLELLQELRQDLASEAHDTFDLGDVRWNNRKAYTTAALFEYLDSRDISEFRIPDLDVVEARDLARFTPAILQTPGDALDLGVRVAALAPLDAAMPSLGTDSGAAPLLSETERDRLFKEIVDTSALNGWLAAQGTDWSIQGPNWVMQQSDGVSLNMISSSPDGIGPSRTGWRQQHPVNAGLQVITDAAGAALVATQVGLYLAELDGRRLPDQRRHSSEPLPAALSVGEALELISALITTAISSATKAVTMLVRSNAIVDGAVLHVTLEVSGTLAAAIDLSGFEVSGKSRQSQLRLGFRVQRRRGGHLEPAPDSAAAALLAKWFTNNGVRGHREVIQNLLARAVDRPAESSETTSSST